MKHLVFLFFITLTIGACLPPQNKEITDVRVDLNDPIYRSVLNHQDRQDIDSLFHYLSHKDPSYRYAAAMAFASFREAGAVDTLAVLLNDNIPLVRTAAAYALGQIGEEKTQERLIAAFNTIDTLSANNETNATILSAVGKSADASYLDFIAGVTTYRPTDTLLLFGQAKAIYNYALRDITTTQGTEKMIDFLSSTIYPESVRLIAANYTKRAKNLDLNNYKFRLNKIFLAEQNPFLKMDIAIALGKTTDPDIMQTLLGELAKNNDYRVKINILRSLGNFTYIDVIEAVIEQLKNPNLQIAKTAAQFLVDHGQPNDVIIYRKYAKEDLPWQVKSKIFEAIIKHVPVYFSKTKSASIWDIRKNINSSSDPYEKAAYLKALGNDYQSLGLIKSLGFDANELPARTASMEALNTIISRNDLESLMNRYQFTRLKKEIASLIQQAFESGDVGMIALAASGFSKCSFDLAPEFEDLSFIKATRNKLILPRDVETYNEILKLESKLNNKEYKAVSIGFNHPINWDIFDKLGPKAKAIIETNKGNFEIILNKENAPASVVNFVELAESSYYEGKRFHRVVPNFVIQTGCSRGDGWGSLEYSIRSELKALSYDDEGFVGMASAGNHTESSQWFVTHSPTIHLDGNYTIFGKVEVGMDVVHNIAIGDVLQSVKIIY